MTMKRVAILGLGIMGSGMARQLLGAGYDLSVWNRNSDKAAPLVASGAKLAATPAAAVREADLVVAMVSDDNASRAVWTGPEGALGAMGSGAIAIECSTLTIDWVRELGAMAERRGVRLLDAPVTGSKDQAFSGTLRFTVGGAAETLEDARPVLDVMGCQVEHLGPAGSGTLFKLVNNFLCGVQVATLAEALAMVEASGLDRARTVALLADGAAGSPLVKLVARRMAERTYEPNFQVSLMAKDLSYAEAAFGAVGIELSTAASARARFEQAAAQGLADKDIAAIVEPLRAAAAGERAS